MPLNHSSAGSSPSNRAPQGADAGDRANAPRGWRRPAAVIAAGTTLSAGIAAAVLWGNEPASPPAQIANGSLDGAKDAHAWSPAWRACLLEGVIMNQRGPQGPALMTPVRVEGGDLTPLGFSLQRTRTASGLPITHARVQKGTLLGEVLSPSGDKAELKEAGWKQATLQGTFQCPTKDHQTITVDTRIVDAIPSPFDPDTWHYSVEIQGPNGAWVPVCSTQRNQAIPVSGVWDAETGEHRESQETFSFACSNAAVAKCYNQWYRPWDQEKSAHAAELHAACTRMARADYCGNGKSATYDGTLVDVWDSEGVLGKDTEPQTGEAFEAAWTSKGAVCMDHPRWPALATSPCLSDIPSCRSEEEARTMAGGKVLVFNASSKSSPANLPASLRRSAGEERNAR